VNFPDKKRLEPGATFLKTDIYVISLETSSDRRESFKRHCAAADATLPWRFFDAHTTMTNELSYRESDAIAAKGRALYPRELAAYSSHYASWAKMLREGADQLLVLEDDVVVDWEFLKVLSSQNLSSLGISYLKLFNKNITPYRVLTDNFHRRCLIDCRGFSHGMQAYMLTRGGAERFLAVCKKVSRPIDDEMDRSWAHGVPNLAVFPFPAFERHVTSTIGTVRYDKHDMPTRFTFSRNRMRLEEKLRRARQKITGYGHVNSVRF
jgi:glycosyl transferase, family 25